MFEIFNNIEELKKNALHNYLKFVQSRYTVCIKIYDCTHKLIRYKQLKHLICPLVNLHLV